jgi:hypothetical protein
MEKNCRRYDSAGEEHTGSSHVFQGFQPKIKRVGVIFENGAG